MSSDPIGHRNASTLPDSIEAVIVPRAYDLGGFEVRRALPSQAR